MTSAMEKLIEKAGTLMDALPYIRAFWKDPRDQVRGHAMESPSWPRGSPAMSSS